MSAPSFNADNTIGALLIGTLVSYALFGVTTTQAYIYYGRFPGDPRKMKAMVTVVWLCEVAHGICIGHALYVMVVKDYGHPERLAQIPVSLYISTFFGSLISACVQSFFAYRIYVLSNSLWIPCICWAMSLFRLLPSNIVVFAFGVHESIVKFEEDWNWLMNTVWAVSAANDLFIAGTLVFLLYRQRVVAHKRTVAIVDKLITWTIETGVITSFASVAMLALFVSFPTTFIFLALFVVLSRLFSISLIASLNSRVSLRECQAEFSLPSITSPSFSGAPKNLATGIEMSKVTMTSYDN